MRYYAVWVYAWLWKSKSFKSQEIIPFDSPFSQPAQPPTCPICNFCVTGLCYIAHVVHTTKGNVMSETAVTSFIIRFIQEQDENDATWRGLIRHVQTSNEIRFTNMTDALKFMANYVDLGTEKKEREIGD